jgi:hypothetical protein
VGRSSPVSDSSVGIGVSVRVGASVSVLVGTGVKDGVFVGTGVKDGVFVGAAVGVFARVGGMGVFVLGGGLVLVAVGITGRSVGVGAAVGGASTSVGEGAAVGGARRSVGEGSTTVGRAWVGVGWEGAPGGAGWLLEGDVEITLGGTGVLVGVGVRVGTRVSVIVGEGVGVGGTSWQAGGPFKPSL